MENLPSTPAKAAFPAGRLPTDGHIGQPPTPTATDKEPIGTSTWPNTDTRDDGSPVLIGTPADRPPNCRPDNGPRPSIKPYTPQSPPPSLKAQKKQEFPYDPPKNFYQTHLPGSPTRLTCRLPFPTYLYKGRLGSSRGPCLSSHCPLLMR